MHKGKFQHDSNSSLITFQLSPSGRGAYRGCNTSIRAAHTLGMILYMVDRAKRKNDD